MLASTEKLIKLFEERGLKHRFDRDFSADIDVVSVRIKHPDRTHTDFAVFVYDICIEASIEAVIGKTFPKQRPICLEILNQLTNEQKWIRYSINDNNIILAKLQIIATEQALPSLVFQLLYKADEYIVECKRKLTECNVL